MISWGKETTRDGSIGGPTERVWFFGILFRLASLASRGVLCKTPPFQRGFSLTGRVSGRVSRFWARSGLGCPSGFMRRQEGFAMQLSDRAPDSRSGLIMGDFVSGRISRHEGPGAAKIDPPGVMD